MPTPSPLKAGTGIVDLTPPIGTKLAGGLRPRDSVGVCTNLLSKAAVFSNEDAAIAIVSVDLCVLCKEQVDAATALIYERTGIPPNHVMVAASHTHAGPYTAALFCDNSDVDPNYLALLPRYIADSATIAHQNLRPAAVGSGSGAEATSSHYRRVRLKAGHVRNTWMRLDPDEIVGPVGEIDPEVGVLLTRDANGDVLSAIFNYTLHANCHEDRGFIDASYPVRVAHRVEGAVGGMTSYTPGACGNINPVGKPDQVGEALANEILRVIPTIQAKSDVKLRAIKSDIVLPLRDFSELRIGAIRRDWPEGEDVFTHEWCHLRQVGEESVGTSVQVLAINETAFVAAPGEFFVEFGREIKQRSPFERTYVVELANDYVGYIPTREAFEQGGYEVLDARSSKVGPDAGEIVVEECVKLLQQAAG